MAFSDSFFHGLNDLVDNCKDMLGWTAHAHTRLYTSDSKDILVADDGSMVSLIRLDGSLRLVGNDEFSDMLSKLNDILGVTLAKKCHALQIIFQYDPGTARESIAKQFQPIRTSARALELDLDDVICDWRDNLSNYCADESVILALWTRPTAITPAELKKERARMGKVPGAHKSVQGRNIVMDRLRDIHRSQVESLTGFFLSASFKASLLEAHEAVRVIRQMVMPEHTADDWRPVLPGDPMPMRPLKPGAQKREATHIYPPTLARQIWGTNARIRERKYIEVGERIYAPFILELPPQNIRYFNELFKSLLGDIPWRMSILLTGDGLASGSGKESLATMLAFAGTGNKLYSLAWKQLKALELEGATMVKFQACFTTWVNKNAPDCMNQLSRYSARVQTAVQSWGSSETADIIGDALLAYTATLPAMMPTSPAPAAIAPLVDALSMLPISRPTSPWRNTDLPLRTPDGRYMPMGLFSSNQASWNEIVFAGMGSGKSFFLNTLNLYFVLRPGQARLPWLTIIDIGMSCSGVINLIRSALPPEKQHLAVFAKLRNSPDAAINPFDTPLGCDAPLRNHFEFLVNLLSLLCTGSDRTSPVDGVPDLLRESITHAYRIYAPRGDSPKRFDPHLDPQVTESLRERQYTWDPHTTWWEVVYFLYDEGLYADAQRAQRFAVPTIADMASIVTNRNVAENFLDIKAGSSGETVPQACSRHLVSAITAYPILANPSKFSLGSAQIVGLDLMDVTPKAGEQAERQSGIMYMLARFVGAGHFFNTLDDLESVPAKFREYHRPRFENLSADPKRLCYDEFHRAACADLSNPLSRQIINDLTTVSREARKLNLSIGLYSQRLDDFPPVLVSLANNVYALGAGNAQEAREISKRFEFNGAAFNALRRINRPTAAGANFVAIFRTADGESIQYLTNSAGSYARWAFSSTAEDMRLRNRLTKAVGLTKTLRALVQMFPEGSAKPEIERRKLGMEQFDGEVVEDIELTLYEEVLQVAQRGGDR